MVLLFYMVVFCTPSHLYIIDPNSVYKSTPYFIWATKSFSPETNIISYMCYQSSFSFTCFPEQFNDQCHTSILSTIYWGIIIPLMFTIKRFVNFLFVKATYIDFFHFILFSIYCPIYLLHWRIEIFWSIAILFPVVRIAVSPVNVTTNMFSNFRNKISVQ